MGVGVEVADPELVGLALELDDEEPAGLLPVVGDGEPAGLLPVVGEEEPVGLALELGVGEGEPDVPDGEGEADVGEGDGDVGDGDGVPDGADAEAFLPSKVETKKREHISAYFEPPGMNSLLAGIGPADVHNRDPRVLALVTAGATVRGNGILAHADNANVVFCQLVPWQFEHHDQMNLKRTFRRASCLVTRLAANMGVAGPTPVLVRFLSPARASRPERRRLDGLYLDVPEEWDDPYRFFRW